MNDMKDLFSRVLDADVPPLANTRDSMLALAHRAETRRRTRRTLAGCVAVTAVVAAAVGAPQWLARPHDDGRTPAVPPQFATPQMPPQVTPEQHSKRMLATLLGKVPKHLTTPTSPIAEDSSGQKYQVQGTQAVKIAQDMNASTDVYNGEKSGSLSVTAALVKGPAPTGNLCVTGSVLHQGTQQGCRVATSSSGERIRFSWRTIPGHGRIEYAARFYDGGYVMVSQGPQGLTPGTAPLPGLALTEQELADAAADPAFWPTNLAPFPDVKPGVPR